MTCHCGLITGYWHWLCRSHIIKLNYRLNNLCIYIWLYVYVFVIYEVSIVFGGFEPIGD